MPHMETERKFLIGKGDWDIVAKGGVAVSQGYLPVADASPLNVRVRLMGGKGYLTLKGRNAGATRAEFEYEIPPADARDLLALCPLRLDKTRFHVAAPDGHRWEIDLFHGDNAPLTLVELELAREDEDFDRPPWLGDEVTGDPRYCNEFLAAKPYKTWQKPHHVDN